MRRSRLASIVAFRLAVTLAAAMAGYALVQRYREPEESWASLGFTHLWHVAALALEGNLCRFDVERDVNETTAIVYEAKRSGGESAVVIAGGGSPKNYILQTEPQIQEVLGLDEKGHDYFIQFTDARPDTGGLSGATPSEAMTWGKVDPEQLPGTVVCYADSTIALPILTAYALASAPARPLKRLYDRRDQLLGQLRDAYLARLEAGEPPASAGDAAAGTAVGRATPHTDGEGER